MPTFFDPVLGPYEEYDGRRRFLSPIFNPPPEGPSENALAPRGMEGRQQFGPPIPSELEFNPRGVQFPGPVEQPEAGPSPGFRMNPTMGWGDRIAQALGTMDVPMINPRAAQGDQFGQSLIAAALKAWAGPRLQKIRERERYNLGREEMELEDAKAGREDARSRQRLKYDLETRQPYELERVKAQMRPDEPRDKTWKHPKTGRVIAGLTASEVAQFEKQYQDNQDSPRSTVPRFSLEDQLSPRSRYRLDQLREKRKGRVGAIQKKIDRYESALADPIKPPKERASFFTAEVDRLTGELEKVNADYDAQERAILGEPEPVPAAEGTTPSGSPAPEKSGPITDPTSQAIDEVRQRGLQGPSLRAYLATKAKNGRSVMDNLNSLGVDVNRLIAESNRLNPAGMVPAHRTGP